MAFIHFLLVYDHRQMVLVGQREYADADAAAEAYAALERQHSGDAMIEVVLVGADSLDTIRRTHGNYFAGVPSASPYLSEVS